MARPVRLDNAPRAFTRVFTRGQETVVDQTEETTFREERFEVPVVEDWSDPKAVERVVKGLYASCLRLQDAVREATAGVRSLPPWVTIQNVAMVTGVTSIIQHRLGRPYRGWRAVRPRDGQAQLVEIPNTSVDLDRLQVSLVPYADCTVDIEVW